MAHEPLIKGIHAAMIGVRDFAPLTSIFAGGLDWQIVARANLDEETCRHLWQAASRAELVVLAPLAVPSGRIHLVRFPDLEPAHVDGRGPRSVGFRSMNSYALDMGAVKRRVIEAGGGWGAEVKFDIEAVDGTVQSVHQGRALLPDDAGLVFVSPRVPRWTAAWAKDESAVTPEVTSVVAAVPDMDATIGFWGPGGLGLDIRYDTVERNPEINRMLSLEPDAGIRVVWGWGAQTARVEFLGRVDDPYNHIKDVDVTDAQRPGRGLGVVSWVVTVDDLDHALSVMIGRGGRLIAEPVEMNNDVYGDRRVATVETPERTWLSVWEGHVL